MRVGLDSPRHHRRHRSRLALCGASCVPPCSTSDRTCGGVAIGRGEHVAPPDTRRLRVPLRMVHASWRWTRTPRVEWLVGRSMSCTRSTAWCHLHAVQSGHRPRHGGARPSATSPTRDSSPTEHSSARSRAATVVRRKLAGDRGRARPSRRNRSSDRVAPLGRTLLATALQIRGEPLTGRARGRRARPPQICPACSPRSATRPRARPRDGDRAGRPDSAPARAPRARGRGQGGLRWRGR